MVHLDCCSGILGPTLHGLSAYALTGIMVALVLGGVAKGIVGIGVPLVAMPILSQLMPVKQAVLLLSMPVVLGNIPQALEGGELVGTVRRIAAPLVGTVLGNIVGVTILVSLEPHHAQAAAGSLLIFAAALLLASPRFTLAPKWVKPVGFVLGFGAAMMESIASIPGPLLALYLIASGVRGKDFTKQMAMILVVSIVTLLVVFKSGAQASGTDLIISAVASIPVIVGMALARPLRDKLPPHLFRVIVLIFVLAAAAQMIRKAFGW
jgi:uncharacterized membrane protein YfcA